MSKRILNFNDEVDFKLQELKKELGMPTNKIIALIINEKLEDLKRLKREYVEDLKIEDTNSETEIRFRIKEKEKIFLEEQIKKTGNNSLTSEIKYRLINSIYKNKYFLPIELSEFKNLTFQIKRIGLNINGIFKRVNFKEELKSDDYINLQNSINEVNEKIDLMNNEVKNILKFASNRD
ncbi:hypothetical protein [Arcobacter sp. CECT 9188]|uniref:hypothetical protein n=1 Tax=Arcobacter sp. CECT 9188 TaxID=2044505 RepID=UPI000DEAE675|nr:hypothetical protein [Arcobacter sp. CECT 9188]RBQ27617.1 hypothetical protein CRU88_02825 [Arcobacter sp. CECT 9188]